MLLHQQIFALNLLTRGVFLWRVKVLDDLEHKGKRGLVEHQHDHALNARGNAKFVGTVALVVEQVTVEQGLALLGQAQSVVDFRTRFARHHAAQKLHIRRWHIHVDHEVSPREAEQNQQIFFTKQGRVDDQLTAAVVQNGQCKRYLLKAVDDLAHHIRAFVAKEQAREHLHLKVGAQLGLAQALLHISQNIVSIAL